MIPYIFATVSYAAGIFLDTTNNYQLTKSSTLKTNCFFCAKDKISSFNNFSNVLHYIQKASNQCKIK